MERIKKIGEGFRCLPKNWRDYSQKFDPELLGLSNYKDEKGVFYVPCKFRPKDLRLLIINIDGDGAAYLLSRPYVEWGEKFISLITGTNLQTARAPV